MTPVERGAVLLDIRNPGWFNRIDCANLDIGSGRRCIIGQLYGSYSDGYDVIFPNNAWGSLVSKSAINHGFYPQTDNLIFELSGLNAEWREVIAKRRLAGSRESVTSEVVSTLG